MFTMSMEQFVVFARDCRALAPSTPVTVGEVRKGKVVVPTRQFVATYGVYRSDTEPCASYFFLDKVL